MLQEQYTTQSGAQGLGFVAAVCAMTIFGARNKNCNWALFTSSDCRANVVTAVCASVGLLGSRPQQEHLEAFTPVATLLQHHTERWNEYLQTGRQCIVPVRLSSPTSLVRWTKPVVTRVQGPRFFFFTPSTSDILQHLKKQIVTTTQRRDGNLCFCSPEPPEQGEKKPLVRWHL